MGLPQGVRGWLEAVLLFQSSGERGRVGIARVSFGSMSTVSFLCIKMFHCSGRPVLFRVWLPLSWL